MRQVDEIRQALLDGKSITPLDALRDYGCFRLAARIDQLRKQGYCITTEFAHHNGKKYASYRLISKGNAPDLIA
jgi:hypothetical protein